MTDHEAAIFIAASALVPVPHGVTSAEGRLTIEEWGATAPHVVPGLCIREHGRVVFLTDLTTIWVHHPGDWEQQLRVYPGGEDSATTQETPLCVWTGNPSVPGSIP